MTKYIFTCEDQARFLERVSVFDPSIEEERNQIVEIIGEFVEEFCFSTKDLNSTGIRLDLDIKGVRFDRMDFREELFKLLGIGHSHRC